MARQLNSFTRTGLAMLAIAASSLALISPVQAGSAKIGSCYDQVRINDVETPRLSRDLYIVVDQTLIFDKKLQEDAYRKLQDFVEPGTAYHVVTFSANAAGRYASVLINAQVDTPLENDVRYDISKKTLTLLDACQKKQALLAKKALGQALLKAFGDASTELPHTELMGNLANISRNLAGASDIADKYLVVISDMIENSDLLSFYQAGNLEKANTDAHFESYAQAGAIGDWQQARVYVIGGGYAPDGSYWSSAQLKILRDFWTSYFEHSNARMMEFGTPSLLGNIGD
ncbi:MULTISPECIES: hypothetical protein [unclassified Thalassospira]|uniref:hypothetical protein n=1 Tax=unclassified Thalassospira TaxID=2648997 RepID=UPI000A1F49DD|nr:hypothetical protein [Thalassospira sp. MCCC 1A01428]OSQ43279.1 hypothetical protein THS27_11340 [Thalassospira sp. MCCC 1A01428]